MPIDLNRVQDVFQTVAELPPAERAAVLQRKCSGNAELFRRVEVSVWEATRRERKDYEDGHFP